MQRLVERNLDLPDFRHSAQFLLFLLFEYISKQQYFSHLEKMVTDFTRKLLAKLDMQAKEWDEGIWGGHCGPGTFW